jgi:hypothetical protein
MKPSDRIKELCMQVAAAATGRGMTETTIQQRMDALPIATAQWLDEEQERRKAFEGAVFSALQYLGLPLEKQADFLAAIRKIGQP